MKNRRGYILVFSLIIGSIIMFLAIYLLYSSTLDNQIINTCIKNIQASYNAEDKINLCFGYKKYFDDDLIPRLKHYIKYKRFSNHINKNKIVLDKKDLETWDSLNILDLEIFRENGILKGSIKANSCYQNVNKTAIAVFNVINPIYNVSSPIISSSKIDDSEFFNDFSDLTLSDFENKAEIIEVKNYDMVNLYVTDKSTNKVKIEFYRYGQDKPSQIKYLTKNEMFLVIKNDDVNNCSLSIFQEGNELDKMLMGIIYVQGDLNFYDNINFNGIIGVDGGKLNVYSEAKPKINGLLILNECKEEDSIEEKITLTKDRFFLEYYGIFLPNFIKPEIYVIKQ